MGFRFTWLRLISMGAILGGWRVGWVLGLGGGASAAPASEEAELIRLTLEFERAVEGAGDAAALGRVLHPDYIERCYVLTWTTGYADPFRFNTVQFEAGGKLLELLLMVWYRYGYNRDLTDYYRRDHSFGLMLSFWSF